MTPTQVLTTPRGSTVYVSGDKEFQSLCVGLSYKVKNTIARTVMVEQANAFLPQSQALVHRRTGFLARNLVVGIKVFPRKGRIRVSYGPKKERVVRDLTTGQTGVFQGRMSLMARQRYKILRDPTRYAHLLEFGTKRHYIKSKGNYDLHSTTHSFGRMVEHPGAKPAPFMAPVFNRMARGAVQTIIARSRMMIEQEVIKLAAQAPAAPKVA